MEEGPHTEEHSQRFIRPPCQEHEERHPEKHELDAKVDGFGFGECLWGCGFVEVMADCVSDVVDEGDCTVGGERDDRQEDETEPSEGQVH